MTYGIGAKSKIKISEISYMVYNYKSFERIVFFLCFTILQNQHKICEKDILNIFYFMPSKSDTS